MKLEIKEGSENYACTVVKLPVKQKVEGLDKLVKVTIFGNDVLTQKDTDESILYLFFPVHCAISQKYLGLNNEFRESTFNVDRSQKGYFEPSGRVKAIKFKGIISTGYLAPCSTVYPLFGGASLYFKEGDEFTHINGEEICKKYKAKNQHATEGTAKESRFNKKLKAFNKLVKDQFRFHVSTSHLAKSLHVFQPEDIIAITDKWHGTSAVFANLLINKELTWKEKLARYFGIDIHLTRYDRLYSSRTVIKNKEINKDATAGYYNEDIWGIVNKELEGKIEPGISIYGEIVGYLPSGKMIQKDYDYGCAPKLPDIIPPNMPVYKTNSGNILYNQHKFLVYRITYTKPDGTVIEFSWQQIKDYCKKYSIETVKEFYFGKAKDHTWDGDWDGQDNIKDIWRNSFFNDLSNSWNLEKDCSNCITKVPAEGIVVRRDGLDSFSAFKLKSKRFLEKESKQLDAEEKSGEVNIEENA